MHFVFADRRMIVLARRSHATLAALLPRHAKRTNRFKVQRVGIRAFVAQPPLLLQFHDDLHDAAGFAFAEADFLPLPAFPFPDGVMLRIPNDVQNALIFMKHAYNFHGGLPHPHLNTRRSPSQGLRSRCKVSVLLPSRPSEFQDKYSCFCIAAGAVRLLALIVMEIDPLDEHIRTLCQQAATAKEAELEAVLRELRLALQQHSRFVRRMATQTLNRIAANSSSSKAAD
jgi:hypothetical protein